MTDEDLPPRSRTGSYMLGGPDGKTPVPADIMEAAKYYGANPDKLRVARTVVPGGFVSTVFLVHDHAWSRRDPVLFETMIFGGPDEGLQTRYSSYDEAVAGHAAVVAGLRSRHGFFGWHWGRLRAAAREAWRSAARRYRRRHERRRSDP